MFSSFSYLPASDTIAPVTCRRKATFSPTPLNTLLRNRRRFVRQLHLPRVRVILYHFIMFIFSLLYIKVISPSAICTSSYPRFSSSSRAMRRNVAFIARIERGLFATVHSAVLKLISPFKGCYQLFSGAVGRRSRSSVGAIVRELDNSEETTRNVAAACLGKLTTRILRATCHNSRVSSLAKQRPKMLIYFVGRLEFATGTQQPERLLYLQSAIPSRIQHNHTTSSWRPLMDFFR